MQQCHAALKGAVARSQSSKSIPIKAEEENCDESSDQRAGNNFAQPGGALRSPLNDLFRKFHLKRKWRTDVLTAASLNQV